MKKNEYVYVKRLDDYNGHEVWLVDGEAVRRDLDEDFVQYEHYGRLRFIPKNEYWIEQDTNADEWGYFLENLAREEEFMQTGMTADDALDKAADMEQTKRIHSPRVQKILASREVKKEALQKIKKQKLEKFSTEKFTIWLVDGELVRDIFMSGYAAGGHDLVYPWVPKGEVWIEEVLPEHEQKFILLHELHERFLMHGGRDYEHAHAGATIIEDRYRENPKEDIEARIHEEMERNMF
jgi:hypothetical protein